MRVEVGSCIKTMEVNLGGALGVKEDLGEEYNLSIVAL